MAYSPIKYLLLCSFEYGMYKNMKKLKLPDSPQTISMGSIIHWNKPISKRDRSGTIRTTILIICGKCKKERYWRLDVVFRKMKTGQFIGVCKKCFDTLTWKEKHRPHPANRKVNSAGYIRIYSPKNPMADMNGEVYEHRLVMSQTLGRPLKKWEHVHHKDTNRANNSPENLELVSTQQNQSLKDMTTRIKYLKKLLIEHKISF